MPQMSAMTRPKAQVCLRALIYNQTIASSHPNGPHLCFHHQAVNSRAACSLVLQRDATQSGWSVSINIM